MKVVSNNPKTPLQKLTPPLSHKAPLLQKTPFLQTTVFHKIVEIRLH